MKFFLNSSNRGYLRSLEPEFGESTNAIRQELNRFEKAGLLIADTDGNKKVYHANTEHPLFPDIHTLLMKHVGLDTIINKVVHKLGKLQSVYLVGELAKGKDSKIIDLWFVGNQLDKNYLLELVEKVEELVDRKIRYIIISLGEFDAFLKSKHADELLLLWNRE